MGDTLRLLWVAFRELFRLWFDALGDLLGYSLPYAPDRVCQPAVLTRLLNEGRCGAGAPSCTVTRVASQGVPSVSSNCENLVLTVTGDNVPDSLFVKLPMASFGTRWFFSVINSWRLESHFFQHVAADLPLRTPRTYATAWRGSRFYLIQENLREDDSVQLFTNPDMLQGPSLALVHRCLDTFARLHCAHYGLSAAEREQILPLDYHPMLSPTMGALSKVLHRVALGPCKKRHPDAIPADIEAAYRMTQAHWDSMVEQWYGGPLSLLHGDSHLGNFFVSGDSMGMLDWQAAHWGKGIRDVAYFLIDSVPADVLAANERQLVAYYVERRAHHGTAIDLEQTWEDYRGFSYHTLMTIIVSIGFGALNEEQEAVMTELLHRSVAAARRLDYPDWLAAKVGSVI